MPNLIILSGLPGAGKSTIAERFKKELGYELYSLCGIRRLFGHTDYNPEQNDAVFSKMFELAKESLRLGKGVILDSNFVDMKTRKPAIECTQDVVIIECVCSENEAKKRMRMRLPSQDGLFVDTSDPKAYDNLAGKWEDYSGILKLYPHVSYMAYNSEDLTIKEMQVNKQMHKLILRLKKILASF